MLFYIIAIVCGVLFLLLLTIFLIKGNKLKLLSLKINEAEKDVSEVLNSKYEELKTINEIMKKKDKEDLLKEIETLNIESINNIELNKELSKYDKAIIEITDYNKEIVFDEDEEKEFDKLAKIDVNRLAIEKFYNDNVTKYNAETSKFISNIISKFKKYKKKELFSNEKEEIFEILKK